MNREFEPMKFIYLNLKEKRDQEENGKIKIIIKNLLITSLNS